MRHGWHQVAQKSPTTTLPGKSFGPSTRPSVDLRRKSGWLPIILPPLCGPTARPASIGVGSHAQNSVARRVSEAAARRERGSRTKILFMIPGAYGIALAGGRRRPLLEWRSRQEQRAG